MLIRWREQAEADLDEIFDYLLDRNPHAALGVRRVVHEHLALLAKHPGMGRPGRVAGTRELVIARTPYLVAYTADALADTVIILRVLHARVGGLTSYESFDPLVRSLLRLESSQGGW